MSKNWTLEANGNNFLQLTNIQMLVKFDDNAKSQSIHIHHLNYRPGNCAQCAPTHIFYKKLSMYSFGSNSNSRNFGSSIRSGNI